MAIQFKQMIIHSLQVELDGPILSKECATLTDETENLMARKVLEIVESVDLMECKFQEQMSLEEYDTIAGMIRAFEVSKFKDLSILLAKRIFAYMMNYTGIDSGDLVVSTIVRDGIEYLLTMKLNYKKEFKHFIDDAINIVVDKNTYNKKISEAVLINLESLEVFMVDRCKEKYLRDVFDVECSRTRKEKEKIINYVVNEMIDENFENTIQAKAFAKNNILQSIEATCEINVDDVLEATFGDSEELIETAKKKMGQFGLVGNVEVKPTQAMKYAKSKVKTNTGIEIKLPTYIMNDPNLIQFVNNPDGTIEVRIKNVAQLVNK